MLPVVLKGQSGQSARAALAWAVEGDHVESAGGDTLPDAQELLDQRVESAVDEHRPPVPAG